MGIFEIIVKLMLIRKVKKTEKAKFNKAATHVIQSWEWGNFREKTGVEVIRLGEFEGSNIKQAFQLTLHPIPFLKQYVGYFPKGPMPNPAMIKALTSLGKEKNIAFIKLEPNIEISSQSKSKIESLKQLGLSKAKKSLFTKYNFILDISRTEQDLLASMHPKTRYNIKVAQKKGVEVYDSTDDKDFETYLKLYFETTKRQKYYGHTPKYHRLVWKSLKENNMARVLVAKYQKTPLVAWMLLNFKDTLYYPYGGSSTKHKEVMASNLVAWEAIKLGKRMGLEIFDMWGALGPNPNPADPWHGFHRFKAGYGARHVEYLGSFDLVLNKSTYRAFNIAEKARWAILKAKKQISRT